jgi:hypothetical protein
MGNILNELHFTHMVTYLLLNAMASDVFVRIM